MVHPLMFDDDDPLLLLVRQIALGFPGADEKISHGRPAFFTTKVFAYYGGSIKVDGAYEQHEHSLVVLPDEEAMQEIGDAIDDGTLDEHYQELSADDGSGL